YAKGSEQPEMRFKSWHDFLMEFGDCDEDMNLLFRWDWVEGADWELPEYSGDDNYRNGLLYIFWMQQSKGKYTWSIVEVCRADEDAVIEYLKPRLAHLLTLWEGVAQ
ncbi:MAG: hypothetical protein GY832_29190, partial [Chloroflexi bacterium]|nr:hypothetical protein [Chloroflexota bacterium]